MGGTPLEVLYSHYTGDRRHPTTVEGGIECGYLAMTVCGLSFEGLPAGRFYNFSAMVCGIDWFA